MPDVDEDYILTCIIPPVCTQHFATFLLHSSGVQFLVNGLVPNKYRKGTVVLHSLSTLLNATFKFLLFKMGFFSLVQHYATAVVASREQLATSALYVSSYISLKMLFSFLFYSYLSVYPIVFRRTNWQPLQLLVELVGNSGRGAAKCSH